MRANANNFKNGITQFGRELDAIITYTLNSQTQTISSEDLNSVSYHYNGDIMKSIMQQLDIDSNTDISLNTVINLRLGVKVDGTYQYLDYGNFIVYRSEKQEDTNSYAITCYDKMLYSMIDYEAPKVNGAVITYPITIRDYLSAICDHLGITFANASGTFVNYDKTILSELYIDSEGNSLGYTFRDVLDELSEVTASSICINDSDELEVKYLSTPKNLEDFYSLPYSTVNSGTVVKNSDNYVLTASSSSFSFNFKLGDLNLEAGTTYTFSFKVLSTSTNLTVAASETITRNGTRTFGNSVGAGQRSYITFTVPSNANTSLRLGVSLRAIGTATISELMLEEGSEMTEYQPFIDNINIDEEYLKDINVNFGEKFGPVNTVILSRSGDADSIVYPETNTYFKVGDDLSGVTTNFGWPAQGTTNADYILPENASNLTILQSSGGYTLKATRTSQEEQCVLQKTESGYTTTTTLYKNTGGNVSLGRISYEFPANFGTIIAVDSDNMNKLVFIHNINDEDRITIKISDNQILNGDDRDEYLINIYNSLKGLEYYRNDFSSPGICFLSPLDKYDVSIGENTYPCVMLNDEVNITQGLEENIFTDLPDTAEEDYTHMTKSDKNEIIAKMAKITADKVNGMIKLMVSALGDSSGNITPASIMLAIDGDESSIKFTADKLDINGVVSANNGFSIDLNGKMTCTGAQINGGAIALNDNDGTNDVLKIESTNTYAFYRSNHIGLVDRNTGASFSLFLNDGYDGYMSLNGRSGDYDAYITLNANGRSSFGKGLDVYGTLKAANIKHGYISSINDSTWKSVQFSQTMPNTPHVTVTVVSSGGGVVALKIRNITTSGFEVIIGGSYSGTVDACYIAICD